MPQLVKPTTLQYAARKALRDVARHTSTAHMKGTVARLVARGPYLRRLQQR